MSQPSFAGRVAAKGVASLQMELIGRRGMHAIFVHLLVKAFASSVQRIARSKCISVGGLGGDDGSDEDDEAADFDVHDAREVGFG